ncbi:MAG TPA: ATP-dependent RNA helicase HrpA, partial [Pirellulaceae bacterium]|nr:ATP-dependent RNA helicase HrpA [Pirellulaceae bacterium]
MSYYQNLEAQIATAMQADRHRLRNLLRAVRKAEDEGRPPDQRLEKLLGQIEESNARREARQALVPKLDYDEALPIVAHREEIAVAIRDHQVVVVCGETGSGKSTQLPKICLEIGRGVAGLIGHTQPRRIAARSIASRLAEELGTSVGQKVGFKIRFTDATGPQTLIKVMTDGVLLAESQHDRFFDQYDTLIIDEAHERSLNIDFLLGYLKRLLAKRDDLRVIITSATIDAERFATHFAQSRDQWSRSPAGAVGTATTGRGFEAAPIIEVSGRTYPVDVLYRPLMQEDGEEQIDPIRGVADAVEEVCRLGGGDVLVFLPTERHILEASHKLRGRNLPGGKPDILPLYARLSTAEQNRVFQPHSGRRIVLATNVAESSLTVPGIRYVVDCGTARISRYSARSKLQRLPIERISQASADQRKGRCGRIGPGVCIRLYDEDDFLSRDKFTSPEIQRTNLASVILQLLALDLGLIDEFPFLDSPRADAIHDGYKTLFELNAIDEQRNL